MQLDLVRFHSLPLPVLAMVLSFYCIFLGTFIFAAEDQGLENADGTLRISLAVDNRRATYQVTAWTGETVIEPSPIGIARSDADFSRGLTLVSAWHHAAASL